MNEDEPTEPPAATRGCKNEYGDPLNQEISYFLICTTPVQCVGIHYQ